MNLPCRRAGRERTTILFLLLSLVSVLPALAQRTDVVVLANGDRVTGEVKELDKGLLRYKTDDMSTIYIEWNRIARIQSVFDFQVELSNGVRYFGHLAESDVDGKVLVQRLDGSIVVLDRDDVVKITRIKRGFWNRLDGSIGAGLSFTKATNVLEFSVSGDARHRTRKYFTSLVYSGTFTETRNEDRSSSRQDLTFSRARFLRNRWIRQLFTSLQQNTEQGINLRVLGGYGAGKDVIQSNRTLLLTTASLVLNREWREGTTPNKWTLESLFRADYSYFKYKSPKADFNTILNVYVGLTNWGRVRSDYSIQYRWEIVKDLFWELSGWASWDSEPPADSEAGEQGENVDWAITSSIGWTF
jgi:hypothetical protein